MSSAIPPSTLMEQGVDMMLYGMGTVFAFLITLVLAIGVMTRALARYDSGPKSMVPVGEPGGGGLVDPLTAKIIKAAIDQHRKH